MAGEGLSGAGAVGDRVLLRETHLAERPAGAPRDEDRIEAEPPMALRGAGDRAFALAAEDLRSSAALAEEEDRLEPRSSLLPPLQEAQHPRGSDRAVHVRRVDSRESAEGLHKQPRVVNKERPADLVRHNARGVSHDVLQALGLQLGIRAVAAGEADAEGRQLRGHLPELPRVRRHERDHVYRPRAPISFAFPRTSAALGYAPRYARTTAPTHRGPLARALVSASGRGRTSTPFD